MKSNISIPIKDTLKLQPPGAGLPFYESFIAKLIARWVWPFLSTSDVLKRFKQEADMILSLTVAIPSDQAARPVLIRRFIGIEDSSRYWSVFMVLDHLRIVDEKIAQCIEDLSNDRPYDQEVRIQDVKPHEGVGSETVAAFIKVAASFEESILKLGDLKQSRSHLHPWFGLLNAQGWLCLASFHHRIHRRQIERINNILSS